MRILPSLVAAFLLAAGPAVAQDDGAHSQMKCEAGPVKRTFGGGVWQVTGCNDQSSLVVTADKDNPAAPFYFFMMKVDGQYRIAGQGTGDRQASDAAAAALEKLSSSEIAALIAAARAAKAP